MAIGRFNLSLTGVQPGGLVYVGGTTFSAASTVSVDNVFSSTYDNYKVIIDNFASVDVQIRMRLRSSGTDTTSSSYVTGTLYVGAGASLGFGSTNNTALDHMIIANVQGSATSPGGTVIDIIAPNIAKRTNVISISVGRLAYWTNYNVQVNTQFDGFTIYPGGGTITGSVKVYGYRNDNN